MGPLCGCGFYGRILPPSPPPPCFKQVALVCVFFSCCFFSFFLEPVTAWSRCGEEEVVFAGDLLMQLM